MIQAAATFTTVENVSATQMATSRKSIIHINSTECLHPSSQGPGLLFSTAEMKVARQNVLRTLSISVDLRLVRIGQTVARFCPRPPGQIGDRPREVHPAAPHPNVGDSQGSRETPAANDGAADLARNVQLVVPLLIWEGADRFVFVEHS
jgi:hypothetical protein